MMHSPSEARQTHKALGPKSTVAGWQVDPQIWCNEASGDKRAHVWKPQIFPSAGEKRVLVAKHPRSFLIYLS